MRAVRISLVAFTLLIYFTLGPFGYLAFTILSLIPTADPDRRARRLQRITQRAFTLVYAWARLIRAYDLRTTNLGSQLPEGPCVIVANHPTLLDAATMIRSVPNMTTSVKPSIFRQWWMRGLLAGAGHFEGSVDPLGAERIVEAAVDRLRRGFRVVVFPEGTRSPHDTLRPFGRTAFEIACRANVPVVPVAIHTAPLWLTHQIGFLSPPKQVPQITLTVLEPRHPDEFDRASRDMRDAVRSALASHLRLPSLPPTPPVDETDER